MPEVAEARTERGRGREGEEGRKGDDVVNLDFVDEVAAAAATGLVAGAADFLIEQLQARPARGFTERPARILKSRRTCSWSEFEKNDFFY